MFCHLWWACNTMYDCGRDRNNIEHTSHQTMTRHTHCNQDQDPLLNQGLPHWHHSNLVSCCVKETPLTEDNTSVELQQLFKMQVWEKLLKMGILYFSYINGTFLISVILHETVEIICVNIQQISTAAFTRR